MPWGAVPSLARRICDPSCGVAGPPAWWLSFGVMVPTKKQVLLGLAIVAGVAAVAIPVVVAIHIAGRQALQSVSARTLSFARDVLARSEATADQILTGIRALAAMPSPDACSAERLALMRRIDLSSSYIQAIGHTEGNVLVCSSLALGGQPLDLGPVDLTSASGVRMRRSVALPIAEGIRFLVIEWKGYAAIVHKDLPIDISTDVHDLSLATFALSDPVPLTSRGHIDPAWVAALKAGGSRTFVDGGHVVAVAGSNPYKF